MSLQPKEEKQNSETDTPAAPAPTPTTPSGQQLLNVNVINEETNAKMISGSSCSIASNQPGKKTPFRLKTTSTGSGSSGGLLASIKSTTLNASKILSRATSASRSSSPTHGPSKAQPGGTGTASSAESNSVAESSNASTISSSTAKKIFKLKGFKQIVSKIAKLNFVCR